MLRLSGDSRVMSRPPTDIAPLATATKPQIALNNVVLPQPDEPRSAMNSPAAALNETPSSTQCAP
jgi:hypothetical protein